MEIVDRIVITIMFMAILLRPTEPNFIYGFGVVIVWLIWEGMILIVDKYIKKPCKDR